MKKILVLTALFIYAEAAYSMVGAQLFYGYRWQKKDDIDNSAHLTKVSAHVDPLPFVPVALGVSFYPLVLYRADENRGEESASGMEVDVELLGWLPMIPFVTPHARLSYTVWGNKKTTYSEQSFADRNDKVSGMGVGIGATYDLLPILSVMAEVSQGLRKVGDTDFNATTLSIGVGVSI